MLGFPGEDYTTLRRTIKQTERFRQPRTPGRANRATEMGHSTCTMGVLGLSDLSLHAEFLAGAGRRLGRSAILEALDRGGQARRGPRALRWLSRRGRKPPDLLRLTLDELGSTQPQGEFRSSKHVALRRLYGRSDSRCNPKSSASSIIRSVHLKRRQAAPSVPGQWGQGSSPWAREKLTSANFGQQCSQEERICGAARDRAGSRRPGRPPA